ncbi:uncharacterized protein UHOD_11891 [Ustilago sp. UG-2017b]|nr:uncharacterized protein UHOD_11891 [Ustilago sp. UG-2017b]
MTDPDISNKLDRLLALLEAQLELTRQGQREERLRRAHLTEEATDLSHLEYQAGGGDESMIGDPHTPTPAPRPRRSVSFADMDEQEDVNYEKYASPTGPRYVKSRVVPYNKSVMGRNAQEARGSLVHMEGAQCSLHGDHGLLRTHMRRRTGSISEESQAQPRRGPSSRSGHSHEEDQAQGACRQLPFRGSRDKSQRNRHRSKEEEQCIGDRQASPEEEEQCRRRRHSSGGQEWC